MATFGRHVTSAVAQVISAKVEIEDACKEAPNPQAQQDLWRIYHELEKQLRQLSMVGRENGIELPVYWVDDCE